jgi:hypothetical protein
MGALAGAASSCPAEAQQVTFKSDWETGITGPGRWLMTQVKAADRLVRVTSPVRYGSYAAKVEVRPGDLVYGGERSEVAIFTKLDGSRLNETPASGTHFYAISVRLATDWPTPRGTRDGAPVTCNTPWAWGVVFQLHGPDSYGMSPAFALVVANASMPGPKYTVSVHAGRKDLTRNLSWELSKSDLALGRWVDFIVKIKFAQDASGAVTVWRRDQGATGFTQVLDKTGLPTLQYTTSSSGQPHYWKTGFYRPSSCSITNRLWIDGPVRGSTFDAVRQAAFGS